MGPVVEGGPRMISLSHSLDVAVKVRPSVMEATRQQRFLERYRTGALRDTIMIDWAFERRVKGVVGSLVFSPSLKILSGRASISQISAFRRHLSMV